MPNPATAAKYVYRDAAPSHAHAYLLPTLMEELDRLPSNRKRIFDVGCGNGSVAGALASRGWEPVGVDPSEAGIAEARKAYPDLSLQIGSAYDDLADRYGNCPAVISLEVVEHLYSPRTYAKTLSSLLEPGGTAFVSTPYHGASPTVGEGR